MSHPSRDFELHLGRKQGIPAPAAVDLVDFVDVEKTMHHFSVREQRTVDWSLLVKAWFPYLNTQYGDCTCASVANGRNIAAAASGDSKVVTDEMVLRMYEHSGFSPGVPGSDQGWTLEAAEEFLRTIGLFGSSAVPKPDIVTAANVNVKDPDEAQVACELFGGLHVAAEMPENAQAQFQNGEPWHYVPGEGSEPGSWGGHALWEVKAVVKNYCLLETWGTLQGVSRRWQDAYIVDKRVLIWADWEKHLPAEVRALGVVDFQKLESLLTQVA